jgi:Protein kinase domain
MAKQKGVIIILAIVLLLLSVFFILFSTRLIAHSLGTTIFNGCIYFTICCLYINRISGMKWKFSFVVVSLGVITAVVSAHFYLRPQRWEFESRLIYCIDCDAMVAFLLINFTQNRRSTFLCTAFVAEVSLIFINREESEKNLRQIFTVFGSIIVYAVLSTYHVKQIWDRRWKIAAITSIFVFTLVLGIIIRIYWYKKEMLFAFIASMNTCLSLFPWLWLMCAQQIKAWWQAYFHQETIQDEQYNFLEMAGLPTRFTIKELETATRNFQSPIGEGASGSVFKGTMADGSIIAVKRIKWQASGETEFRTEMTIIATRQHVNLVRLLGFCLSPRGDRYLIYPFLENGSLDAWLFVDNKKRSHLTWVLRYHIAIDVAKALAYLHHDCHHQILHLDIKPANILLDGDFRALLSDFGISKLIGKDESSVMTKARGTVSTIDKHVTVQCWFIKAFVRIMVYLFNYLSMNTILVSKTLYIEFS